MHPHSTNDTCKSRQREAQGQLKLYSAALWRRMYARYGSSEEEAPGHCRPPQGEPREETEGMADENAAEEEGHAPRQRTFTMMPWLSRTASTYRPEPAHVAHSTAPLAWQPGQRGLLPMAREPLGSPVGLSIFSSGMPAAHTTPQRPRYILSCTPMACPAEHTYGSRLGFGHTYGIH